MRIRLMTLVLGSTFLLTNCTNKIDNSLVGYAGCTPPCWQQVTPGKTSTSEAIQKLQSLEAKGEGHLQIFESDIEWQVTRDRSYYLYSSSGIVTLIKLYPAQTNLKEVLSLFGTPEYLALSNITDVGTYKIIVFFPQQGIAFMANSGDGIGFQVAPEMQISMAFFTKPATLDEMLVHLYGPAYFKIVQSGIQSWTGYGELQP